MHRDLSAQDTQMMHMLCYWYPQPNKYKFLVRICIEVKLRDWNIADANRQI